MDNVSKAQPEQHAYHPLSAQDTEQHLQELFSGEEKGYHKGLKNRQIQMIALGGAIGTGLFMGAGGRLATAGPSLMFVYLACGVISYLVLRALGNSSSIGRHPAPSCPMRASSTARRPPSYAGWVYWFGWAMAGYRRHHRGSALHAFLQQVLGTDRGASRNGCSPSSPWSSSCR